MRGMLGPNDARCQGVLDAFCAAAMPGCDGGLARLENSKWGCYKQGQKKCFMRNQQLHMTLELCNATLRTPPKDDHSITVVITASYVKAHPALTYINRTLVSLRLLKLQPGTPVLLAHDPPMSGELPPRYMQYFERLRDFIPKYAAATGLTPQLLIRRSHGHIVGNIAFALSHVHTPYLLKAEHDVEFVASINLASVVRDMQREPAIKVVRFNHRTTSFYSCDRGYFGDPEHNARIFSNLTSRTQLENAYTRSVCFSDMAHITTAAFYRDLVLTSRVTDSPCVGPEGYIQPFVALDHAKYGTYVFGAIGTPASVQHNDAKGQRTGKVSYTTSVHERNLARWCSWFKQTWWCVGGCQRSHPRHWYR